MAGARIREPGVKAMTSTDVVGGHARFVASRAKFRASSASVDALVLDGETRQALTSARVLGRSGLRIGVAAARLDEAPAMHSRWCDASVILPPLETSRSSYVDELIGFLDRRGASVVVPTYDGSIEALRGRRSEIERRAAVALAPERALEIAVDKEKTLSVACELRIRTPSRASVTSELDIEEAVAAVGLPAVLKPLRSWTASPTGPTRLGSLPVTTIDEARAGFELITSQGGEATLQQWLPGRRDAVTVFKDKSGIKACFAQMSHRELPRLGGVSVLCESIPPLRDITEPARQLVSAMGLEGCSIVEFRRDSAGKPVLMEVNPRLPGSVALAVGCGIDFPRFTYEWALGHEVPAVEDYPIGRRLHWMVGDVWSLYSALNHDRGPDVPAPRVAWREFLRDALKRDIPATFDVADLLPSLIEANARLLRPIAQRIRTPRQPDHSRQDEHELRAR
jgi:predicted ATP-grasp superfamily ATP-dependent carboligase